MGGGGKGGERDPDVAAAADWLRRHEGGGSGGGAAGSEVRGQGAGLSGARAESGPGASRIPFGVQGPNPESRGELGAPAGRSGRNLSLNHSAVIKAGPGLRPGRYRGVGSALGSVSELQTHREVAPGCRASPGSLRRLLPFSLEEAELQCPKSLEIRTDCSKSLLALRSQWCSGL